MATPGADTTSTSQLVHDTLSTAPVGNSVARQGVLRTPKAVSVCVGQQIKLRLLRFLGRDASKAKKKNDLSSKRQ